MSLRSLYWKITLPLVLTILAGMAALGFYIVSTARAAQLSELRTYLVNEARLVGDASQPGFAAADSRALDALAKSTGAQIGARITLIRRDGVVLGDSWEDPAAMENHARRPEVVQALSPAGAGVSTRYSTTVREDMMYAAVPVPGGGEALGVARVALPLTTVAATVGSATRAIIFSLLGAALLIVALTAFMARRITRPLREITRATEAVAAGSLTQKVQAGTGDELGRLGQAFNEMSRRLAVSLTELKGERRQLTTVLASIADGVLLVSAAGDVMLANQAAAHLFGFPEEGAAGRPVTQLVREPEVDEALTACLRSGREKSVRFESQAHRYLRVIAVPLAYDSHPGALLLCQDLTELRDLQTMRKELIGNISHEFRTPLAGLRALVETLEDGALAEPVVARDFLGKIHAEVDRLTQMVAELTELSRIESGRTALVRAPLDLNQLIRETVAQLAPLAERQGLALGVELAPGLPQVTADRERLRHVLTNLLHNAVKFTPAGGRVTVGSRAEAGRVVVSVADTGIGIAPADLPHVFERFYKADRARAGGGTGLGLAIVKHTVQAHGGEVWAESTPGKGSVFYFSLPLK